ncbi:MAG: glycogen debranching enzyme family protein, partial [Ktedonobacteraceae bacterium]|nr:glycogen debranching enzyme family protein [Ktedonobacteraceae bacterium]
MFPEKDAGSQATNAWHLQAGRAVCSSVQAGLDHEWLVTNGLGGYASGSLVGATTRSYHGLLVAALRPPVERTVLVTKIDEEVTLSSGQLLKLGVNEYIDGTIDPHGYRYLQRVCLEGDVPCFHYLLNETLVLEKRVWMEYGQNTTYVQYILHGVASSDEEREEDEPGDLSLELALYPFCLSRDYHSTTYGSPDWHFLVDPYKNRCTIRASQDTPSYQLIAPPQCSFTPTGLWYWRVFHRRDRERGLSDHEDTYQPGIFRLRLSPGMRATLVLSAAPDLSPDFGGEQHEERATAAFMHHQRRVRHLLAVADHSTDDLQNCDPVFARLTIAADQFIVARTDTGISDTRLPPRLSPDRKTIIAGYPWFTDWGRDSMISLPGLLLSTGRYSEARGLLKAFASFTCKGLIPNRFPDSGADPEYNTGDATLWMFHALDRYLMATGDWTLLKELFPTLQEIIRCHIRGTLYGIKVDVRDGLLYAGAPGLQLTWMDAKVGNWVVTPRRGKPVEINALWYAALTAMEAWAVRLSIDATSYSQLRTLACQHFADRFWYKDGGYLYDVIDVDGYEGQNDASLRPNQLFAASLTRDLLSEAQVVSMLRKVTEHLLTPVGLRSLSPEDPAYHGRFQGNPLHRDSAYHQGTAWQWLIGPYVDVHLSLYNDHRRLRKLLQPLVEQLWGSCLGTISEAAEPEPPFAPVGC